MAHPRLTVGIPTFNRPEWLRESMESVLTQSYEDFCLIVSDNAPNDETAEVVRSFGDLQQLFEKKKQKPPPPPSDGERAPPEPT